jgi:MFS-type transporter involved in bile tolerance (Atg22 family)
MSTRSIRFDEIDTPDYSTKSAMSKAREIMSEREEEKAGGYIEREHLEGVPEDQEETSSLVHSLSPSERASIAHPFHVPKYISWFERPFQVKSPTTGRLLPEATGWAMDSGARGPLNLVGSYVGVALVRLASIDAGCTSLQNCEETVYGLKPTSFLTAVTAAVGVTAALVMPLVGAVVDHTPHRRIIARASAAVVVVITGIQMTVNQSNWFIILCLEAIGGFCLLVHAAAVYAYLPDLSIDEKDYIVYTSSFNVRMYSCQTLFAALVTIISRVTQVKGDPVGNGVRTSRAASAIAFSFSIFLMGYAWTYSFCKRPAIRRLRNDESLWSVGFISVFKTTRGVFSELKALKWFMLGLLWSPEAGSGVIAAISVTFLQVFFGLTALQIAITLLILLACNLPGSIISKYACNRFNPANSYRLAITLFIVASALGAWLMESVASIYIVAAVLGISLGWIFPSQKVLFCTLIPKGQEFEFMGLFTFFGHILGWLPTLLFTVMNEKGVDMRWGFAILPMFQLLALICTFFMGDYEEAATMVSKGYALDTIAVSSKATDHARDEESNTMGSQRSRAIFVSSILSLDDQAAEDKVVGDAQL